MYIIPMNINEVQPVTGAENLNRSHRGVREIQALKILPKNSFAR